MNNLINIVEVKSKRDLKDFINLPWKINQNDPYWVPPLRKSVLDALHTEKNDFWKANPRALFLAKEGEETVGRIVVFLSHQHQEFHQDQTGFFGFLEGIEDKEVFKKLCEAGIKWLKAQGCNRCIGPMNPSINYEIAFLIEGFESPPYFMLTHNPAYYQDMMVAGGFGKIKDFYAYLLSPNSLKESPRIKRIAQVLAKKYPIKIRQASSRYLKEELAIIGEIYNDAFAHHWGFVPMSKAEFNTMAKDLKAVLDDELVLIAEYEQKPVGFILALPNLNEIFAKIRNGKLFPWGIFKFLYYRKTIKTCRVMTIAIKKQYQHLGLGSLFYQEITKIILAKGYQSVELSWVLEDNVAMNKIAREIGGKAYKTYRLYEKEIQ